MTGKGRGLDNSFEDVVLAQLQDAHHPPEPDVAYYDMLWGEPPGNPISLPAETTEVLCAVGNLDGWWWRQWNELVKKAKPASAKKTGKKP